jgi:type IV pilus assembly protein PilV
MIEVLVALVVLAIGMLGVAAMQLTSLRNSQSAFERTGAVIASDSILDAMRANAVATRANAYNLAMACTAPTGTTRVAIDQARWITDIKAAIGTSACGSIACANSVCRVTVRWDDSRATEGSNAQSLVLMSRI